MPHKKDVSPTSFSSFIAANAQKGHLVCQPRMGFGTIPKMREGLNAVKNARAPSIGTLTLDSYTRVNQYHQAQDALDSGVHLNGFPIVNHGVINTRNMLDSLVDEGFVVQVRHGTALPLDIFKVLVKGGIDATEGGPISYCLPYSHLPVEKAIDNWRACCECFSVNQNNHIESFAGCMLGQLCPPSVLIALGILECLFFKTYGIADVSLSYAQGTHFCQDLSALAVMRHLAQIYLADINWHVVLYTYMGMFPTSIYGSHGLIASSARLAKMAACERLIVKTPAEAYRIPSIEENVASIEMAYQASCEVSHSDQKIDPEAYNEILEEATLIIEAVLEQDQDISRALYKGLSKGLIDIPYCLHINNLNLTRTQIDEQGYLKWAKTGRLPFKYKHGTVGRSTKRESESLLEMLTFVRSKYDGEYDEAH